MKISILTALAIVLSLFSEPIQAQVSRDHVLRYVQPDGPNQLIEVASDGRITFFLGTPENMKEIRLSRQQGLLVNGDGENFVEWETKGSFLLRQSVPHGRIILQGTGGLPAKLEFESPQLLSAREIGLLKLPPPGTTIADARQLASPVKRTRLSVDGGCIVRVYTNATGTIYRVTDSAWQNQFFYELHDFERGGSGTIRSLHAAPRGVVDGLGNGVYSGKLLGPNTEFFLTITVAHESDTRGRVKVDLLDGTHDFQETISGADLNKKRLSIRPGEVREHQTIQISDLEVVEERLARLRGSDAQVFRKMVDLQKPALEARPAGGVIGETLRRLRLKGKIK